MTVIATPDEFAQWLDDSKTLRAIYHRGNLAEAASTPGPARDLASAVYQAAIDRHVYLLQRSHGKGFEYIAIKPKDGQVPLRLAPGLGDGRQG
jgi:hypothetical protein